MESVKKLSFLWCESWLLASDLLLDFWSNDYLIFFSSWPFWNAKLISLYARVSFFRWPKTAEKMGLGALWRLVDRSYFLRLCLKVSRYSKLLWIVLKWPPDVFLISQSWSKKTKKLTQYKCLYQFHYSYKKHFWPPSPGWVLNSKFISGASPLVFSNSHLNAFW